MADDTGSPRPVIYEDQGFKYYKESKKMQQCKADKDTPQEKFAEKRKRRSSFLRGRRKSVLFKVPDLVPDETEAAEVVEAECKPATYPAAVAEPNGSHALHDTAEATDRESKRQKFDQSVPNIDTSATAAIVPEPLQQEPAAKEQAASNQVESSGAVKSRPKVPGSHSAINVFRCALEHVLATKTDPEGHLKGTSFMAEEIKAVFCYVPMLYQSFLKKLKSGDTPSANEAEGEDEPNYSDVIQRLKSETARWKELLASSQETNATVKRDVEEADKMPVAVDSVLSEMTNEQRDFLSTAPDYCAIARELKEQRQTYKSYVAAVGKTIDQLNAIQNTGERLMEQQWKRLDVLSTHRTRDTETPRRIISRVLKQQ